MPRGWPKTCVGKKGRSGRKSKKVEWNFHRLKELSINRAIREMEREEAILKDRKERYRLEDRKDEITVKVLDKIIPQEIKLNGNGHKETQIILIRDHIGSTSDQANELSRQVCFERAINEN